MFEFREFITTRSPTWVQRFARLGLRCLSVPYRCAVGLRNFAFDRQFKHVHRSRLATISVGNLSVGGTGKSPTVAWIARWLRSRDLRVAILSRGYRQLDSGQNDEALELELQLPDVPHLQHWDRVASAQLADEELDMQVLLLDDGFQHRRLARDLDLVLLDATDPPSAWHVLPGGLLREPLTSLRRADLVLLTRTDQASADEIARICNLIHRYQPGIPILAARHQPTGLLIYPEQRLALSSIQGQSILAFCGIGNPSSFFRTLGDLGATIVERRTWPDHHAYSRSDIEALAEWAQQHPSASMLVCTVKDWVKIQSGEVGGLPLVALVVELEFGEGQSHLEAALLSLVQELSATAQK